MQKAAIECVALGSEYLCTDANRSQGTTPARAREPDRRGGGSGSGVGQLGSAAQQCREPARHRLRRCCAGFDAEPAALRSVRSRGAGRNTTARGITDVGRARTDQQHGRSHGPVWQRRSGAGTCQRGHSRREWSERYHERVCDHGPGWRIAAAAATAAATTAEIEQRPLGSDLMRLRRKCQGGVRRSGSPAGSRGPTVNRRGGAHEWSSGDLAVGLDLGSATRVRQRTKSRVRWKHACSTRHIDKTRGL